MTDIEQEAREIPVLRVVVMGDDAALAAFEARVCKALGWPVWPWSDSDGLRDESIGVYALRSPMNRLLIALAPNGVPRTILAGFDADVLVLASVWKKPTVASGPPKMYGRQVFSHAKVLLWLGAHARPQQEERTLRGALRACGLSGDDAESVWSDLDPRGEHLATALDAVFPRHPSALEGIVRHDVEGTVFRCGACAHPLTRPMRRTRSHPPPQSSAEFRHNRRMFPGGGVFAHGANADGWGTRQLAPSQGRHEVALFDSRDLIATRWNVLAPWGGGCCGMIPVGSMNLACICGHPVGYVWSECAMYAVIVLRLERVREEHQRAAGAAL